MKYARWIVAPRAGEGKLGFDAFPPWFAQLLHNRGLRQAKEAAAFLRGELITDDNPFLLPDMDRAVARLRRALAKGELVAVYGDFDADGVAATVLLSEGIGALEGHIAPYIPHRLEEGYDLNRAALAQMRRQGVSLVITADCGIGARDQVAYAQGLGLDVIITDHHAVTGPLPGAVAVINPRRADSAYPFGEFSGVGVAYKLLQGLLRSLGEDEKALLPYLDLVALGTITDLSPLLGENRYLVKRGLQVLNATERPGLLALAQAAGLSAKGGGAIDAPEVGYSLGPRLNAAGRLADARASLHLLSTESAEEARRLAQQLEAANAERQRLTARAQARAREEAAAQGDCPLLLVSGPGYGVGIVGLVAGRLCEEFYRPVVVIDQGEKVSRGSVRSIPEFNIMAALAQCQDLLIRFGGHAQAAGFSVSNPNLSALHQRLLSLAETVLAGVELKPSLAIEAEVPLAALGPRAVPLLSQLRPFGKGNPEPVFLSRNLTVVECRPAGAQGNHLWLRLGDEHAPLSGGPSLWPAMGFGLGNHRDSSGVEVCQPGHRIDVAYVLEVDEYRGEKTLRLNVKDLAPSSEVA